jgi:tRNA(Arg) A34 adenosine deaminase TadA
VLQFVRKKKLIPSGESEDFTRRVLEHLASSVAGIEPYSAQEYFTVLLGRALRASQAGNYGISAALIVQDEDNEIAFIGQNTLVSERDPFGHAEANALKLYREFRNLSPVGRKARARLWENPSSVTESGTDIFTRRAKHAYEVGPVLYTTLEPCPMCAVAIMNARIEHIIIANPDVHGGVLAPERLRRLPKVWPQLAEQQGLRAIFATAGQGNEAFQITPSLKSLLHEAFDMSKDKVTAEILKGVMFN